MARGIAIVLPLAAALCLAAAAPAQGLKVSRLMAPLSACPDQRDADAPVGVQERAMRCMTNYARARARRGRFDRLRALDRSAGMKSLDILRCDSFSHFACGRDFTYWMKQVGYISATCWRAGENIAWGSGRYASVRSIFRAWMHSSGHRRNILSRAFDQFGTGLEIGGLGGFHQAHVWTQHFGDRC